MKSGPLRAASGGSGSATDGVATPSAGELEAAATAAFFFAWRSRLRQPIVIGLLLSCCLHLLLLAVVRPVPRGDRGNLVIHARLAMPPPPVAKPRRQPPMETAHLPAPPPAVVAAATPPLADGKAPAPRVALPAPAQATPSPPEARPVATAVTTSPAAEATRASSPLDVAIDANWYLARQVDVSAKAVGKILPEYPEVARQRNQEGTLKLMLRIDDLGRVREVAVVESDLPGVFDQAALDAFRQAHFQPAMKDGHPVRYQAYIRVTFKLHD